VVEENWVGRRSGMRGMVWKKTDEGVGSEEVG
jgi:hypothetical protein